jgi:hypothetical protein
LGCRKHALAALHEYAANCHPHRGPGTGEEGEGGEGGRPGVGGGISVGWRDARWVGVEDGGWEVDRVDTLRGLGFDAERARARQLELGKALRRDVACVRVAVYVGACVCVHCKCA